MWPTLKRPNESICKNFRNYFREYCNSTSIHGFRYFGEKRTFAERVWWFIIFVICLSGCAYFIFLVYNKWENSPVIVSVSTKQTPIYKIPFPAVTICPQTKSQKSRYNHSDILKKCLYREQLTLEEFKQASYMNLICDIDLTWDLLRYEENKNFGKISNDSVYVHNEFFEFLQYVIPVPEFHSCQWMNEEYDCYTILQSVLTDEGICFTFNMLERSEVYKNNVLLPDIPFAFLAEQNIKKKVFWNMDDGYQESKDIDTYPRRALFSGAKNAFTITLREKNENIDHTCKGSTQGYKVTLHTPTTVPKPSEQYFRVPLNQVVIGAIQPDMILTSDTVKKFEPVKRNCYFQYERSLKFFQRYDQHNCNLECLTNFTKIWCSCVNFFMPREHGTDFCSGFEKNCMEDAEEKFQKLHLIDVFDIKFEVIKLGVNITMPHCDCLPLCSDISYNIETSSSQWNWLDTDKAVHSDETRYAVKKNYSVSKLIIYFKTLQFVTSQRHELYGPTDFLGNFGGLLGLFTGFSILSLMEIIYFLTIRIICNIKLYGHWSGRKK